jgi:hypothetical protein
MRYLLMTYYTKPSGKIDEVMSLAKRVRTRDWQTSNVILDFKECRVLVCSINGISSNKDWDTIVSYYYKHYPATIERLFQENGHSMERNNTDSLDEKIQES